MKIALYPGCSLNSTAKEYKDSLIDVFKELDISFKELDEWNCCSASAGHSTDIFLTYSLCLRNLILAENQGYSEITLPCAACYNLLKSTHNAIEKQLPEALEANEELEKIMNLSYKKTLNINHPLEILTREENKVKIKNNIKNPLSYLKVVPYYGCLLTRPREVAFDNVEQPMLMDDLLKLVQADVKKWAYKTDCCSGPLSVVNTPQSEKSTSLLVEKAKQAGADAIITACPLCQMTLESRQNKDFEQIPIFYFTELLALSFSLNNCKSYFKNHLINPFPLLNKLNLI